MSLGLSPLFVEPFFEGSAGASGVPWTMPVAINDHPYLVDLRKYRRATVESQREGSDTNPEQSDASLNSKGLWRRSGADWIHGAGQEFFDDEPSSRRRFESSLGIDCWTKGCMVLLPETELKRASVAGTGLVLPVGSRLYITDGTTLAFTADPSLASPTFTTVTTTGAGTHASLTSDGTSIFTADGAGIWKSALGSSSAARLGSFAADMVGYANGRLLAADANQLVEVAASGTTTVIRSHENTGFVWNVVAAAPNGIYVAGKAGGVSEVYFIGVNATTGALLPPVIAAPWPVGETVESMVSSGGAMVIGTSKGLRVALITGSNFLAYGPVIAAPGSVRALAVEAEFVWFVWTALTATASGVGRASLATFPVSDQVAPAYATDVYAEGAIGATTGVARHGGRTYFFVASSGLWGASGRKVASGYFNTGRIRYGTHERKLVASVDVRHDPLAGSVVPAIVTEDNSVVTLRASDAPESLGPVVPVATDVSTAQEMVRLRFTLVRSATDDTAGPVLRRWTLRSLVTPIRVDELLVPIVMSETVRGLDESDSHYKVLEEFKYLKSLESSGRPVRYSEGSSSYQVYIDGVGIEPNGWADDRSFMEGLILVRLVTMEPSI